MFRIYEFCFFLFFCSLQEDTSLYRMISYLFNVLNGEQLNVFVFLKFLKLIFNFQKSLMSFLLRCSLHCAHILYILVTIIFFLSWHLHFFRQVYIYLVY